MKKWILVTVACAALAACGKKKEAAPEPAAGSGSAMMGNPGSDTGSGSAAPAAGSGSGSAAPAAGSGSDTAQAGSGSAAAVDVPTESDFEDDADKSITEKNLADEVAKMEKDLGQ